MDQTEGEKDMSEQQIIPTQSEADRQRLGARLREAGTSIFLGSSMAFTFPFYSVP